MLDKDLRSAGLELLACDLDDAASEVVKARNHGTTLTGVEVRLVLDVEHASDNVEGAVIEAAQVLEAIRLLCSLHPRVPNGTTTSPGVVVLSLEIFRV